MNAGVSNKLGVNSSYVVRIFVYPTVVQLLVLPWCLYNNTVVPIQFVRIAKIF